MSHVCLRLMIALLQESLGRLEIEMAHHFDPDFSGQMDRHQVAIEALEDLLKGLR